MKPINTNYQAPPSIMGDKAAWKVEYDSFLTCDDGYDYITCNNDSAGVVGNQLDNQEPTIAEVSNNIVVLDVGGVIPSHYVDFLVARSHQMLHEWQFSEQSQTEHRE